MTKQLASNQVVNADNFNKTRSHTDSFRSLGTMPPAPLLGLPSPRPLVPAGEPEVDVGRSLGPKLLEYLFLAAMGREPTSSETPSALAKLRLSPKLDGAN